MESNNSEMESNNSEVDLNNSEMDLNNSEMESGIKSEADFVKVKEGKAEILFPTANSVFYNPVQEFNRDLTIAVITEFIKEHLGKKDIDVFEFAEDEKDVAGRNSGENGKRVEARPGVRLEEGVTVLEALSASGLRSMRFARELPGVSKVVANDLSSEAYDSIVRNIRHNAVTHLVQANVDDASMLMYRSRGRDSKFEVVDVDPYGSAAQFLDAAVQAVKPQGLLCVTCTDMAVMAGNFPEACWAKYQSVPLKTKACHEQALRILLGAISSHAGRYSRYIEPLLAVSVDFYVRVFVRVHFGQRRAKSAASKQMQLFRCVGCSSFNGNKIAEAKKSSNQNVVYSAGSGPPVDTKCQQCGKHHKVGGPYWGDPLHDRGFAERLLGSVEKFPARFGTAQRMIGVLHMIKEELHDVPFHYVTDELSSVLRCGSPPNKLIRSALLNAGYRVSSFHGKLNSIKTDAPNQVVWDIMREWAKTQDVNEDKLTDVARAILGQGVTTPGVDFTLRDDATPPSMLKGITRYPDLPPNWGPKARAKVNSKGEMICESLKEKSKKFQGKRNKKSGDPDSKKARINEARTNEAQPNLTTAGLEHEGL